MKGFWKGVFAVLTLQWLFGRNREGGCGCGGCATAIILGICALLSMFGLL